MPGKLTEEQNDRVRAVVERLISNTDNGNVSAVARAIHRDQSWLQRFVKKQVGTSFTTAAAVARNAGMRVSDLLGISDDPIVTLGELPGFSEALEQARAAAGSRFSETVWANVGATSMPPHPARVEVFLLLQVAAIVESFTIKRFPAPPPPDKASSTIRASKKIRT